ncbi:MAG: methylmalonyl Co-A mutase-associated GTPase MeaB [Bacteroidales bacterium]|nr:methylmalonyl Co-A mutase-associated GTPase MeaB [Bacteroidales bacterium]
MPSRKKAKGTLHLSNGVTQPDSISREALQKFKTRKKEILQPGQYIHGILDQNRTLLSRAITLVESSLPEHQEIAARIIEGCIPHSGNALRIGITGVPGVGKSTFIESMGKSITAMDHKLAVLAIDPSSERSGGSIMGDKTRMEELSQDLNAFIRPSPSGGSLGGVARKTRETIILCESAGFDVILVETVGVGQSETTVHSMVDFFLLLMLSGAGDELQGIKRGIMEMADLIAITKADGTNMEKAGKAKTEYQNALHLYPPAVSGWIPKVLTCSALEGKGLDDIWEAILEYAHLTKENGFFQENRNQQAKNWMYEFIHESLTLDFYSVPEIKSRIKGLEKKVMNRELSSFHAAKQIMEEYKKIKP